MPFIARHTRLILLISGVLTCTLLYAAVAPQAAVLSMFGAPLRWSRSWCAAGGC